MKYWRIIGCALPALSLQSVLAEAPAYNYTELAFLDSQYRLANPVNYNWYQDGGQVDGSYAINNRIWLAASYSAVSGEKSTNVPVTLRTKSAIARAGYIFRPTDSISIDVAALWRFDNDAQPLANNNGPGASLGARARFGAFEVVGRGAYLGGDFDGGYSANAGALWHFSKHFAVTSGYQLTSYDAKPGNSSYRIENVNLGVRFTFPTSP